LINPFSKRSGTSRKAVIRWPRAIARLLDLGWELTLVFPPLHFITAKLIPETAGSIGWLIAQIKRNYAVWTDGMAMGILPFTLYSGVRQFRKISNGRSSTYDRQLGFHVSASHNSGIRLTAFVLALLTPALAVLVYSNIQRQTTNTLVQKSVSSDDTAVVRTNFNTTPARPVRDPIQADADTDALTADAEDIGMSHKTIKSKEPEPNIPENILWTNPLSGLSTQVSGQFNILPRQDDTNLLASFNHRASDTTVDFEQLGTSATIDTNQLPTMLSKALDTLDINANWIDFEFAGLQIFESSGVDVEKGMPVSIQATLQTEGSSQRILFIVMKGENYTNESAEFDRLRAAVWSSI